MYYKRGESLGTELSLEDLLYKPSLKSNISKGLTDIKEHKDSIFPKEFEYHSDSHI